MPTLPIGGRPVMDSGTNIISPQVVDLVTAIAAGAQPLPSFADGFQVQCVLDAVERSADAGVWLPATESQSA